MHVAPQALKSVLPVEDSFSNKEMHTFSRISTHRSTNETFNTSLWREKQSQLLSTTSPLWFWRRIRLVVHFREKFLSFLCCGMSCSKKRIFITMSKRTCFIFQSIFLHFFQYTGWPEGPETDIVASSDSISHLIYCVFRWYILTFLCYCTAGETWSIFIVT